MELEAAGVEWRTAGEGDEDLLFRIYGSTRTEEMELVSWSEAEKEGFLRMQFAAQDRHYRANYPGAEFRVLLDAGRPVGRLYLHRRPGEIRLMDLALLPEARGRGLGTRVVERVLDEARAAGSTVTIHVERLNRALRLYERLGFRQVADRGVYLFLEWRGDE